MTLLKEKMQSAGVDTASARLASLAVAALQECDGSLAAATEALFRKLSKEPGIVKDALLLPYLIDRQHDMRGGRGAAPSLAVIRAESDHLSSLMEAAANKPTCRGAPPNTERKRTVAKIVKSAVDAIRFKHLTSDGRDWATVGAHELVGMDGDGKLARAIKDRLGALSNAQQVKPIGELMTRVIFNEVRTSLEAQP